MSPASYNTVPLATTYLDVIDRIEQITAIARQQQSRIGYFAALYHHVATRFKTGVEQHEFEHPDLISRLDVVFVNRYITALHHHARGERPSRSWAVAFEASQEKRPIITQHLLLGMNAHINFDLGVAAAQTCPPDQLPLLHKDFDKMNAILISLVSGIQQDLIAIWPPLNLLTRVAGRVEDRLINFSMRKARAYAWHLAESLAPLPPAAQAARMTEIDTWVSTLGHLIWKPDPPLSFVLATISASEREPIPQIIDTLLQDTPTARALSTTTRTLPE